MPVAYFHVVFTLPTEIADLAYWNKMAISDLLFRAVSEALLTIAADPKHLGAHIGITAVPHSWRSAIKSPDRCRPIMVAHDSLLVALAQLPSADRSFYRLR